MPTSEEQKMIIEAKRRIRRFTVRYDHDTRGEFSLKGAMIGLSTMCVLCFVVCLIAYAAIAWS